MNRNSTIYLCFALLLLYSCTKENDLSMDFKITGVKSVVLARGSFIAIPLKVFYLGGEKEDVVISADYLPAGITVDFDKTADQPDFESTMTIRAALNYIPDTSIIQIIGISASGKKVIREMKIEVTDPPNHFPTITLNGPALFDLTLNTSWVDPGFTATDVEDGDLTSQVNVSGTVNYNYAGLYIITYEVIDSKGYKATVLRNVRVLNSLQYLAGNYFCTTTIVGGGTFPWISGSTIYASPTKNNYLVLPRMTECYGFAMEVEVNGTLLNLPGQYQLGYNTAPGNSGICDSIIHFITGTGTLAISAHPVITLDYTDQYKDSTGNASSFYKTDIFVRQ